jgi:hypothetical protein
MLEVVDSLAKQNAVDKIVWLGDYCDDWNKDGEQLTDALKKLLEWADKRGDTTLLWGNHDYRYMQDPPIMNGFGYNMGYAPLIRDLFKRYSHLMRFAYYIDGWLFSHAGFTNYWCNKYLPANYKAKDIPSLLDNISESKGGDKIIQSVGYARGGRDLPSPLWADWSELCFDHLENVNQIVGHSPKKTVVNYSVPGTELWCADTWSTYSNDVPIGDGSMLLWDRGKVTKLQIR